MRWAVAFVVVGLGSLASQGTGAESPWMVAHASFILLRSGKKDYRLVRVTPNT